MQNQRKRKARQFVMLASSAMFFCLLALPCYSAEVLVLNEEAVKAHVEQIANGWKEYNTKTLSKLSNRSTTIEMDSSVVKFLQDKTVDEALSALKEVSPTPVVSETMQPITVQYFKTATAKQKPHMLIEKYSIAEVNKFLEVTMKVGLYLQTPIGDVPVAGYPNYNAQFINDLLDAALLLSVANDKGLKTSIYIGMDVVERAWAMMSICEPPRKPFWCYFFTDP
jgi:hypothetical protein